MVRLAIFLAAIMTGTALFAMNAEQFLLFHFDDTRVPPAEAGEPRLREVEREGLILWVGAPDPGNPTILYFHGNAGNLANRTRRFSAFMDHGLGVVAMAYPGSSGSAGQQTSEAIQHHAETVFADMNDLVGPGPVILYGESLGTGVVLQLAASEVAQNNPPAALVLEAPFTSVLDLGRRIYPRLGPYLHWLGDPWVSRDWIAQLDIPLLILHGAADGIIPAEMGQTLFDLAMTTDKQLFLVPGAGHNNVWQAEAQVILYQFLERFQVPDRS